MMSGPEAMTSFHTWRNGLASETDGDILEYDASVRDMIETSFDNKVNKKINQEMLIVGMSANASNAHVDLAFQHGMHFYCPKPVETTMLTAILSLRKANTFKDTLSLIGLHAQSTSDIVIQSL